MSNRRRFPYGWAIFTLSGFVLAVGCSPGPVGPGKGGTVRPGAMRLAPVIRLQASGPFAVPLSFANGSDQPFICLSSGGEIVGLGLVFVGPDDLLVAGDHGPLHVPRAGVGAGERASGRLSFASRHWTRG